MKTLVRRSRRSRHRARGLHAPAADELGVKKVLFLNAAMKIAAAAQAEAGAALFK